MAEAFPWGPGSTCLHLRDNHNSVLGARQVAAQRGAALVAAVEVERFDLEGAALDPGGIPPLVLRTCRGGASGAADNRGSAAAAASSGGGAGGSREGEAQHLFALPLESNLWGVRYDQRLACAVQSGRFLLQQAEGVSGGWELFQRGG